MNARSFLCSLPFAALLAISGCQSGDPSAPAVKNPPATATVAMKSFKTSDFTIDLPEKWQTLDMTQGDWENLLTTMVEKNPQMAQSKDMLIAAGRSGVIKLLAYLPPSSSFLENVNITVSPSGGLAPEKYLAETRQALSGMGIQEDGAIQKVTFKNVEAHLVPGLMEVTVPNGDKHKMRSLGYFVFAKDKVVNVTYTISAESAKTFAKEIQDTMDSLKLGN